MKTIHYTDRDFDDYPHAKCGATSEVGESITIVEDKSVATCRECVPMCSECGASPAGTYDFPESSRCHWCQHVPVDCE